MNPRMREIAPSMIREISSRRRSGSIDLGLGEPSLLPNPEHFEEAVRSVAQRGLKYTPNAGDPELRAAIATHYGYPGMEEPESVCVTVGSQEAMYVALKALLDPARDELLVVEPCFPSYQKMAALEGVAVRTVSMLEDDGFAFDAERILEGVGERTRAIVVCSPCNPTARVISNADADRLIRALEARGGEPVWLVHDEIYREQLFIDDAADLARRYPYTIVTNSLSKSNALTGLRLGWLVAPPEFVRDAIKVHAWVTSCADTFAQRVALRIFTTPGAIGEHSAWYRERREELLEALRRSGLTFVAPEGTFYVCVRLGDGVDSLAAAHALIDDYDVVAIPGIAFGPSLEGWLRLSWVSSPDRVAIGLSRIAEYVERTRASILSS